MSFKVNNLILQQTEKQSLNIIDDNNDNNVLFFPKSIVKTYLKMLPRPTTYPFVLKFDIYDNTYNPDIIGISECIDGNFTNISNTTLNFYIKFLIKLEGQYGAIYTLNIVNNGINTQKIIGEYPNIYLSIILEKNSYFYFTVDRYINVGDAESTSVIFYRI
jgi:hypothetical protein